MSRALTALALLAPLTAAAQDATDQRFFDAHRIQVAAFDGDLRDALILQRPGLMRQWDWFAGGVLEYTQASLVRYERASDGQVFRNEILDNIIALNISAGVAFHERFRMDVAAPLYFGSWDGNNAFQGVAFGDIRLSAMGVLLQPNEDDEGFGLGLVGQLDLPSGAEKKFLGNRTVSGGGLVTASYAIKNFTVLGQFGAHFYPKVQLDNLQGADNLNIGVGLNYKVHETTSLGLETEIRPGLRKNREPLTETPVELTATLRHRRPSGAHFIAGGSAGLTPGVGAAQFRLFLGGGFGRIAEPPPKDMDLDGILDEVDACVDQPETFNDWNDTDGCPDQLSDVDIFVTYQGSAVAGAEMELTQGESVDIERMQSRETPRRKEGLKPGTVLDGKAELGRCLAGDASVALDEGNNDMEIILRPLRAGKVVYELTGPEGTAVKDAVATWRTDAEGCAEADGYNLGADGAFEHPLGAGEHTVFIDAPGYRIYRETVTLAPGDVYVIRTEMKPTKVQIDKKEIKILEKVYFETAKSEIKPESFELLDEVADTIVANDVGRVRVEGHTDSRGNDIYNLDLSQARAEAVRDYLINKGVPPDQLIAVGFGETQPIATNDTSSGRAQNRRVVFTLIDQESQVIEVEGGE